MEGSIKQLLNLRLKNTGARWKVEHVAPFVELGTRPHIIRPKKAKVLAWGGTRRLSGALARGSEPTHFATIVHHPGTKPEPYLLPGAIKAVGKIKDAVVRLWNGAA